MMVRKLHLVCITSGVLIFYSNFILMGCLASLFAKWMKKIVFVYANHFLPHFNISGSANATMLASVCSEGGITGDSSANVQAAVGGHIQNKARGNNFSFQHVAKYLNHK